jgi:uncharacterized protein involved in response to NO
MQNKVAQGTALLALGFRPFFLAAGGSAALLMGVWLAMLKGWIPAEQYYGGTIWHSHEMLFGYAAAVIAGFLLTAVRNWTGIDTLTGPGLGALALLWLAARIAPFLPVPGVLVASLDLAFLPILAASLIRPLWGGANRVNRVFLALMAAMWLASLLIHLQALGITTGTAGKGNRLMLDLVLLTLLLVAGRIMPFFTESGIPGARPVTRPLVERLTFVLAPLVAAANLLSPWSTLSGVLTLILACVQALRLAGWHDKRAWGIPILAVLYAGYLWLTAGLALDGLAGLGLLPPFPALHALTTGAVGVFTLGMMARVTLGHTGREMRAARLTNLAFVLANLAAFARVLLPLLMPEAYTAWIYASGLLWTLAFVLFLWVHAPMLIAPRPDGRPG